MKFKINYKNIPIVLLGIVAFLLVANIIGIVCKHCLEMGDSVGLIKLFDFDTESNIPTYYSIFALLFSSALLVYIAWVHRLQQQSYLYWAFLALIFLFLAIDERLALHERLILPVEAAIGTSGIFYFAWVVPYIVGLSVFVILYLKFLMRLPKKIMVLFVLSGFVFVVGAIGFEMIGGNHAETFGKKTLTYSVLYTFEELLEMLGIVMFIYTLLLYMTDEFKKIKLSFVIK
ncbi:MAG: hypothetical protein ACRBCI_13925 [Cellvibrionaceae bacterium]